MKITDLVFIGIKGSVIALNRATGEQVWIRRLKGADFVNLVLDRETILASCYGEIFCLDALTGAALWHNPLKGFGLGLTTIATPLNPVGGNPNAVVAKRRRDQQSEDSSGAVPATM
jgi:outer membrane protein assembly factor BamB